VYRLIDAEELGERLEEGEELALVDLRDEGAFLEGHLPGAMLVPAGVSVERWIPQRFPTSSQVVLYDAGGEERHAAHEASHLSHLWYQGLLVLQGGLAAWTEAGLPLETGVAVDPMGAGRHIETRPPSEEVIPPEWYPRHETE
jgi:rhodanese-related sulfurtransferase